MFSVVIPVYNHELYLREAVESALSSDLVKEVLICDDGSKDGSADLCSNLTREFPDLVRDYSEKPSVNRGAHYRLNQLCKLATQPWIRVLNSDDFFLPRSFEVVRMLALTKSATCISGSMLICDQHSKIIGTKKGVFDPEYPLPEAIESKPIFNNEEVSKLLLNQNFIATTSNMAFTRELFDAIGGFSDFRYAHDWDFALRATMHGNVVHTSAYLVSYRVHGSNTISEVSPHMDGEITRLFANLLEDFPELELQPDKNFYLNKNRHIAPFPQSPQKSISFDHNKNSPIYQGDGIPECALPNVLLALGCMNYDFVLVSRSLHASPAFSASDCSPWSCVAYVQSELHQINENRQLSAPQLGRLLRCPVERDQNAFYSDISKVLSTQARSEGPIIHIGSKSLPNLRLRADVLNKLTEFFQRDVRDQRPVIFVLPIFLAVGGVERNTIEVIRELKDYFRFVVITSEFLSEEQGSLHWQLYDIGIPVFDLAEIANHEYHLDLLTVISKILKPNIVWICNGSPWLVEQAAHIRRLFAKIPIIDQEVYDTEEGWIAYYDSKGIQSFDKFIAINSKIRDAFIKKFCIPPHKVELIYPMLAVSSVARGRMQAKKKNQAKESLRIPDFFDKIFIYVGRLSKQKQPLRFLELVRSAQKFHPNCFFLMVGSGELNEEVDSFCIKYKMSNLMRIPYHSCPPELMAVCDGMIITSLYEGLPIAMLEALGVGLPVLATDVGDIRLVLEKYDTGLIFEEDPEYLTPENLLKGFRVFLTNLTNLSQNANRSKDHVLNEFGEKTICNKYAALFK
jgi:glycosyltransferase involved in cell wall biosynthesis